MSGKALLLAILGFMASAGASAAYPNVDNTIAGFGDASLLVSPVAGPFDKIAVTITSTDSHFSNSFFNVADVGIRHRGFGGLGFTGELDPNTYFDQVSQGNHSLGNYEQITTLSFTTAITSLSANLNIAPFSEDYGQGDLPNNRSAYPLIFEVYSGGSKVDSFTLEDIPLGNYALAPGVPFGFQYAALGAFDTIKISSSKDDAETFSLSNLSVATAVPEPETYAMTLAGLGVLGFMARRRRVG